MIRASRRYSPAHGDSRAASGAAAGPADIQERVREHNVTRAQRVAVKLLSPVGTPGTRACGEDTPASEVLTGRAVRLFLDSCRV